MPDPARWSQEVTRHSHALALEPGVFSLADPAEIAASLKRSSEASTMRKASAFGSATAMLNFYINRGGPQSARGAPRGAGGREGRAARRLRPPAQGG